MLTSFRNIRYDIKAVKGFSKMQLILANVLKSPYFEL